MSLILVFEIVVLWGLLALLLLAMAIGRARSRVFYPVPRETAPSKTCSTCRLPFHGSSWRCGRCGAYMKPRLFYWIGRFLLEPLLALLVVPWILLVGMILSGVLWVRPVPARTCAPVRAGHEQAGRLGHSSLRQVGSRTVAATGQGNQDAPQ